MLLNSSESNWDRNQSLLAKANRARQIKTARINMGGLLSFEEFNKSCLKKIPFLTGM
jgi:hypothetical protein